MADEKTETGARIDEAAADQANGAAPGMDPGPNPGAGPAGDPGQSPLPEPADPMQAALDAVNAERDALKDKLMRALAEAENIRKRAERDRKDAEAYGGARLARDILDVYDNLGRALGVVDDNMREHGRALIEGVELTQRELLSAFAKHRIEVIDPALGDKFDPKLHQAMFEAPVAGAKPGTVIQVMQKGFTISGRLLRPAMVGIAAAAPAGVEPQPEAETET